MEAIENIKIKMKESISIKILVISFFTLLLLIPISSVKNLIYDRGAKKTQTQQEIYNLWGQKQTFRGPIITIPYYHYENIKDDKQNRSMRFAYFLPEALDISGKIIPEVRYRSIYEAVVYKSNIKISGKFEKPNFLNWNIKEENILYHQAQLSFGITDLRGLKERIKVNLNNEKYYFKAGVGDSFLKSGLNLHFKINKNTTTSFDFNLKLNGSSSMKFLPYGKTTSVSINSSWCDPSFIGDFLPNSREINKDGFSANWKIIDLNRNYSQRFRNIEIPKILLVSDKNKGQKHYYKNLSTVENDGFKGNSSFGVKLIIPVNNYQKSERSIKYAILIIILTFVFFFFLEIFIQKRIHSLQYIFIGFGLIVYFALLISMSEHIGFMFAYLLATIATLTLIISYSYWIFKSKKHSLILFGVMASYYTLIYLLIHLQDYALLMGSVMLFAILAVVMYISRNIDWYSIQKTNTHDIKKA